MVSGECRGSGTCSEGRGLGLELVSGWGRETETRHIQRERWGHPSHSHPLRAQALLQESEDWLTGEVAPPCSALNSQSPTCHPHLSSPWDVSLKTGLQFSFASGRGKQSHSSQWRELWQGQNLSWGLGGGHAFAEQPWREGGQSPASSACSSAYGCVILGEALPSLWLSLPFWQVGVTTCCISFLGLL